MNKNFTSLALVFLAVVALVAVLGWAGDIDFTEHCILHMSYEEYDTIKETLTKQYGYEPSESDIAHWWAEHRK